MRFFVAGTPVAQPRPRARVVQMPGHQPRAHVYNARGSCHSWREAIHVIAQEHQRELPDGVPLAGPVELRLEFVFPRPKGRVWKRRHMPPEFKPTKPDLDNLVKAAKDALNGVVFGDDAQVVSLITSKRIASGDYADPPGVWITVQPAGDVMGSSK